MNTWSIVYSIGASQAALLAFALWRRPLNAEANRVLAAWIALIGIDLVVKAAYFHAPGPALFKPFRFVGLFPFLYGAFFYVYVRVLTQARPVGWRDAKHLAGFVLMLIASAELLLLSQAQLESYFARRAVGELTAGRWWYDVALYAYSLSYIGAALVQVRRYRRGLLARRSDADAMSLRWIDAMAVSQIVIWCIATIHWLVRSDWINYPLIYGAVVAWVFVVGYLSLNQSVVPATPPPEPRAAEAAADDAPLDDARSAAVEARLAQLMATDALYREPALTIGQLARRSGYPEYLVSAVINRRCDGNFWEYINRLRIDAVRVHLADTNDARTILDIAYDCGFTSKSTFNAAFKRQSGLTPSAYRQRYAAVATARTAPD
ncbi:MAG TPA: helix-turn-helix transcriptional regulator [Tahibacter sp.]|nr:helix-turn-helix transcriptional regulator [Tahibacter sp.]